MGLDVYLYSEERRKAAKAENAAWEHWEEGQPHPKAGVDYPEFPNHDEPSTLHPKNINTPNYLRSSYNASGFDSAVPRFLRDADTTYEDIFAPLLTMDRGEPVTDADGFVPVADAEKVAEVRERGRDVARRLRAKCEDPGLTTMRTNTLMPLDGHVAAIEWAEKGLASESPFPAWEDSHGFISTEGVVVHGVTVDKRGDVLLLVKAVDEDGTPWAASYAESAEVLAEEFCQRMLDLIERDGKCYLSWSG